MPRDHACVKFGHTQVLCTATVEEKVPPWMKGLGQGWVTAEYGMLPALDRRAHAARSRRRQAVGPHAGDPAPDRPLAPRRGRPAGARRAPDPLDCDVIQADGGTRTAAITGSWVALYDSIDWMLRRQHVRATPLRTTVAAVSCGIVGGAPVLDLDYAEDSGADTDANFVLTGGGGIVEIQGTAEDEPFSEESFFELLRLARKGIGELVALQERVVS